MVSPVAALAFSLFFQTQFSQQIVVTASELPETVESTPAAVSIITRKDIESQAALDVADVLREVPGLTLARTGSAGKATSLFTRGAASTQTLVLWNGIEINDPYFAGYDWGRFSTAGIEQIEVVRGPFSALYGSDAMAGVVNVLTAPRTTGARAEIDAGGRGLRNSVIDGAYVGSGIEVSGAAEHREDNGFNPNDDFHQNSYNAFAKWAPLKIFSIGLAARDTSYNLGIPFNTNADATALVPSLHRRQDGREFQLALPITFHTTQLTLSQNRRRDDFTDPDDPFTTSQRTDARASRARLTTHSDTTPFGTFAGGAEYERAVVSDVTNLGPNFLNRRRTDRAFFVEDRYSHPVGVWRLELSLGLRNDRFDTFGSQTSPRVAAAFVFGPQKIRAAFGEGFRAPSLGELYFPFFGNASLRAERNRSFELGYDTAVVRTGLFNITYFNARYRDLITFDPTTFVSENIGRVRTDGIELGWQQSITPTIYTAISYTYLHRANDEETGLRLARRPKNSGSLLVGWRSGDTQATAVVMRTGSRPDEMAIAPFSSITDRPYTTIDANVQHRIGWITPFLKVENLADAHYQEVSGFDSPRRRAIFGIRLGS
ncbi:MAG TPA: TonB-dependent receptor [Thermoanaerobaculia bacterium]|nr:TonB-dependent receptor [Thermoanaerobaculia bacterium]